MNEQNKKAFNSLRSNPSDSFQSFRECTEKVLKEVIEDLEKRTARNSNEEETLKMAKEIYDQRFGKGEAKL